jgi:hypothetical protein
MISSSDMDILNPRPCELKKNYNHTYKLTCSQLYIKINALLEYQSVLTFVDAIFFLRHIMYSLVHD